MFDIFSKPLPLTKYFENQYRGKWSYNRKAGIWNCSDGRYIYKTISEDEFNNNVSEQYWIVDKSLEKNQVQYVMWGAL